MYQLIMSGLASKAELEKHYTLDEALNLYALMRMRDDIQAAKLEEMKDR
jgi:hypothetical protein